MKKNFGITGIAGYIAPRHLRAIHDVGGDLVAALDPHDAVGVLDQYFPNARFFTEFERFDRHLEKLRRLGPGNKIDYLSICSPNYLHDAHIRAALRVGADAICEKPLVLNPWNLDALEQLEKETDQKVYTLLQLRSHPSILEIKKKYQDTSKRHQITLTYVTSRGQWYLTSWKGQNDKSGGLATNIGIHFFDMLIWIFGGVQKGEIHYSSSTVMSGSLELKNADVTWFLSIDPQYLPKSALDKNKKTFRSITVDNHELEFSEGFTDLHTLVYKDILAGGGPRISHARPSIELVHQLRNAKAVQSSHMHPFISDQHLRGIR